MSEIINPETLLGIIHTAFHHIADKYDIDVDKVAEIIDEYDDFMSRRLRGAIIIHFN